MNTTKPGMPGYTGPDEGMALWVHHGIPVEYCTSFTERIAYIVAKKPPEEQALRLHALTYIGADIRTHAAVTALNAAVTAREAAVTACEEYATALKASDTAWEAYVTALNAADTAREAYVTAMNAAVTAREAADTAWEAYATAREAYDTAWEAYDTTRKASDTARKAIPWRELAAQYASEVPYTENGTLDFETFNTRKGA